MHAGPAGSCNVVTACTSINTFKLSMKAELLLTQAYVHPQLL
jgi:hypothetical protein